LKLKQYIILIRFDSNFKNEYRKGIYMYDEKIVIYWAGPLFRKGERIWNRECANCLRKMGYIVILPQDDADVFLGEKMDFPGLALDCYKKAVDANILIAVLDGNGHGMWAEDR
jgi:nucleoside 2-deoxyribosyltransferase